MNRSTYTIEIPGEPIQAISSVAELSTKYVRERTGDFTDSKLSAKLGSLSASQLLIMPPDVSHIRIETNTTNARLTQAPELGRTRHESRTEVAFGQLVILQSQRESIAEVAAVKYTSPVLAAREFAATRAVHKRIGEKYAYEPVGFLANETRSKIGYISRYRHEITTLDRVFWNEDATDQQRLASAGRVGAWLAVLHDNGFAHGDAQAKNVAFDSANNPVYPDLETLESLSTTIERSTQQKLGDIDDFVRYQDRKLSTEEFDLFTESYRSATSSNAVGLIQLQSIYELPLAPVQHFHNT